MYFQRLIFLCTFVKLVHGAAQNSHPADHHQWIAPTKSDVRSPCPGLNTLANHGYLPRNGKGITVPMILDAALPAKFSLLSGDAPTALDLDALALHNLVEHDASISRADFGLGDNLRFNETLFKTLANSNPGVNYYNASSAGLVMKERLDMSIKTNPNITNTPKEFAVRIRESAFYLSVMGNVSTGVAPKQFVQIFFREERLPIQEGWRRSKRLITAESMDDMSNVIAQAANWTATQSCEDLILGPNLVI
ncbi:hypothetical protein MIND_00618000 [Mycena indigotica]|uniref:Heme haloperoxidase family profile domain-containing protein n=1 Tax=Mycena indigotica TaxID=2126181 RepID=A0A8H6W990_9AGAR|nr:uncharacterized protein MIND_00618000 [Mycena indigotica]KAF7303879.1 hypothetical protein MIND_00618000 [Mycena indigotica]